MSLSRSILFICLSVLGGLLWLTALLIIVLIGRHAIGGTPAAVQNMQLFWLALAAAIGAWASGFAAARLRREP